MEIIDNINTLLGDDLKQTIKPGSRLKIAASCFSIYAFEALKKELESIESLEFIFTAPTFVPTEVSDKDPKDYLPGYVEKAGQAAFDAQCIPTKPEFLVVDAYKSFLAERRTRIAERLNAFMGEVKV